MVPTDTGAEWSTRHRSGHQALRITALSRNAAVITRLSHHRALLDLMIFQLFGGGDRLCLHFCLLFVFVLVRVVVLLFWSCFGFTVFLFWMFLFFSLTLVEEKSRYPLLSKRVVSTLSRHQYLQVYSSRVAAWNLNMNAGCTCRLVLLWYWLTVIFCRLAVTVAWRMPISWCSQGADNSLDKHISALEAPAANPWRHYKSVEKSRRCIYQSAD